MANILRNRNVEKGDRVTIYLPMIPEAAYAMLACARIGAIHSVVFGGFSPDRLAGRIEDCQSKVVITADEGLRGGRKVPLKANTDAAIAKVGGVDHVIVVRRTGGEVDMDPVRDVWYHEAAAVVTSECPCERDERRGSAVHPLHLGLDRQAEGRAAHHRRLSASTRRSRINTSSTITTATSTGAPPTSAGSPATATSSTARSRTAPPR